MLDYKEFEKSIFNWFMQKNTNEDFTFSLRQMASKGAESDYFIGTQSSMYFATTFWTIPVGYPGSAGDLIQIQFRYSRNKKEYVYFFELNQTNSPDTEQNRSALSLIKNLKTPLSKKYKLFSESHDEAKIFSYKIESRKSSYESLDTMLEDVDSQIYEFIEVVNQGIQKEKESNSAFIAERITSEQFNIMLNKALARIEKHSNLVIPELIIEEKRNRPNASNKIYSILNQILYGPPGTGKTYHTINKAVQITNPDFDISQHRAIIKAEYKRLVDAGQIVFTTFHQSMSYEDFVEGIKPVIGNESTGGQINYAVEDGIFKSLCQQASFKDVQKDDSIDWGKKDYFKLSLGGIARPDVHDYCLDHNIIALGYGGENDLSDLSTITDWHDFKIKFSVLNPEEYKETTYSAQAAFTFLRMNIGDVVVISKGNRIVDAVGIVESEYYYDDNVAIDYKHFRKVKWLSTRMNYKPDFFLDVNISQMTIYEFYKHSIKIEAFKELFSSNSTVETSIKPHVLIIDEINRGNVSAIFGELITLIEDSKREDQPEALEVILPYSKEKFSVPPNLYIIGTMNTADRSVEALDTALRRRFVFEELLPNPSLLNQILFGYEASALLEKINKRIEKLMDRDHCIGHAYFLDKDEESFIESFYKNIIPLLQEYFFGDYGKIGLVLGSGFIKRAESEDDIFASFDYDYKEDLANKLIYQIVDYRQYEDKGEHFKTAIDLMMNNV